MNELPPRTRAQKIVLALDRVAGARWNIGDDEPFEYVPWGRELSALVLDVVIAVPLLLLTISLWKYGLGLPLAHR